MVGEGTGKGYLLASAVSSQAWLHVQSGWSKLGEALEPPSTPWSARTVGIVVEEQRGGNMLLSMEGKGDGEGEIVTLLCTLKKDPGCFFCGTVCLLW